MRLATLRDDGQEALAVIVDNLAVPVVEIAPGAPTTMARLLASGHDGLDSLRKAVAGAEGQITAHGRALDVVEFLPSDKARKDSRRGLELSGPRPRSRDGSSDATHVVRQIRKLIDWPSG